MKSHIFKHWAIVALAACLHAGAAGAELPADCMPLSEIRPGMIGEAMSVISGFELSSYRVEIIGVERGSLAGSAMILAKVEGPGLGRHGIVGGMSGSPVTIDGKVIGAIAYGWSFAYAPIAGITPIEDMLSVWDGPDPTGEAREARAGAGARGRGGAEVSARGWDWRPEWEAYLNNEGAWSGPEPVVVRPTTAGVREISGGESMMMEPLLAPFYISGVSGPVYGRLEAFFASRGLKLMAAGSAAGSQENPAEPSPPIRPGSAIGLPIMTGDVTVSSIGTVTYIQGDRMVAFGHPAFSRGADRIPMSQAYIFGVMQSYQRSFKLGETREIIGEIRQDRMFAVGGVFGKAPERIEMQVNVGGGSSYKPRKYRFSIWKDRDFLAQMAGTALLQSYGASIADGGEVTGKCWYEILLKDGRTVTKEVMVTSRGGAGFTFFITLLRDLFLLEANPFGVADIKSIAVDIQVEPGFRNEAMLHARPRYSTLEPGDEIQIDSRWRPYRAPEYERRFTVKLPDDLEPGNYVIHLANSQVAARVDQRHDIAQFAPRNLDQVLEVAERLQYPQDELTIYLFKPGLSFSLNDASMEGVPGSIGRVMSATIPTGRQSPILGELILKKTIEFDHPIVSARASFPIEVRSYVAQ